MFQEKIDAPAVELDQTSFPAWLSSAAVDENITGEHNDGRT
jgi:hypothetical protein